MPAEPERFAKLFARPTVEEMHALTPREFERFVAYVLRRAGYEVKEVGLHFLRGVDLEVRRPGKPGIFGGVECKRYAPGRLVPASVVRGVRGAPAVDDVETRPIVITTSDFHSEAHQMAETGNRPVYLINGTQFVRYIRYVRGSRRDDDDTLTSLSPEFFAGRDQLRANAHNGATILTIANNKGGVGKTTTAYYLGIELARVGERVLLIDLDGQANLTEWCFPEQEAGSIDGPEVFPNVAQYISGDRPLHDLVKATIYPQLSIVPSDPHLTLRDLGGSGRPDIETRFRRDVRQLGKQDIASLDGKPTWIIIDTPPAMSAFTRAGLAAGDYVLAPVRPRKRSLRGTKNVLTTLETVNALTENGANFIGVVITHADDLKLTKQFLDFDLPSTLGPFGATALVTQIPTDNQLDSLQPSAQTKGMKAYAALAAEVKAYVNTRRDQGDGQRAVNGAVNAENQHKTNVG